MIEVLLFASNALVEDKSDDAGPLEAIDGPMLERICRPQSSLGGEFGTVEIPNEDQPKGIGGFPRWDLDEAIGPFTRYSRWAFAPSYKVHTIRYHGRRIPDLNLFDLYEHMRPIAEEAGWEEFEDLEFGAAVSWRKQVQTDGGPLTPQLAIDGGILSKSIYYVQRPLYDEAWREIEELDPGEE